MFKDLVIELQTCVKVMPDVIKKLKVFLARGVFGTQSSIYDNVFFENS